jgi:putative transposase
MAMRTFKRHSEKINRDKWNALCLIARQYRAEKNTHLSSYYASDKNYASDPSDRSRRDYLVKQKYRSLQGLQARMWKLALKEAYETVDKQWAALIEELRSMVYSQKRIGKWSDVEVHYAYWLLQSTKRFVESVSCDAPAPAHFEVIEDSQRRIRNYLRRVTRRKRGRRAVSKSWRSFALDANMYSVFEKNGRQYISIMTLERGKRLIIPLKGWTTITGNIRIVLDFEKLRVEVHVPSKVEKRPKTEEAVLVGLDAGVTEVFVDENGKSYGEGYGKIVREVSNQLLKTGKARNKSHKLAEKSGRRQANRIRKFNLGRKKLEKRRRKARERMANEINRSIRQVASERKPSVVVTERLDIRGKAKSKHLSRLVSNWHRTTLKERMEFLALVEGFHHQQVNPAYTSQKCPTCGFVQRGNRVGDIFQCLYCGHSDHADRVAAINLKARYFDSEITPYTPAAGVKQILMDRFIASLEQQGLALPMRLLTVSGRTGTRKKGVRQSETPSPKLTMGAVQECRV